MTDAIPGNPADVVVSETSVQSLGTPVWDPAGDRIAVTANVSNHALILVMRADGTGGEVASSDTMLIGSDPQWSPDGRRIAYTMSTLSNLDVHDIYVTDLTTHAVTRVTTGAHAVAASIGWTPDGASIIYSHPTGSTGDEPDNVISELVKVDVSTGASQTLVTGVIGQITGIARAGDRVLISRAVATSGGGSAQELVELSIGGSEHVSSIPGFGLDTTAPATTRSPWWSPGPEQGTPSLSRMRSSMSRTAMVRRSAAWPAAGRDWRPDARRLTRFGRQSGRKERMEKANGKGEWNGRMERASGKSD